MSDIAQLRPTIFDVFALNRAMLAAAFEIQRAALQRMQQIVEAGANAAKAAAQAMAELADDLRGCENAAEAFATCRSWCLRQTEAVAALSRSAVARLAEFLGVHGDAGIGTPTARFSPVAVASIAPATPLRLAPVEQPRRRSGNAPRPAAPRRMPRKPAETPST